MPDVHSVARSIACLGVGCGIVMAGAVIAPTAAATTTAAASATLLGNLLSSVGQGVLGNLTHETVKSGYDVVAQRLRSAAETGMLPENHDLIRALRRSQLNALEYLLTNFNDQTRDNPEYDQTTNGQFVRSALIWIKRELRTSDRRDFFLGEEARRALRDEANKIGADVNSQRSADATLALFWEEAAKGTLEELREGATSLPQSFVDWFHGAYGAGGFALAAHQFFFERVKVEPRLQAVIYLQNFAAQGQLLTSALERLSRLDAGIVGIKHSLSARFDALEDKLRALSPQGSLIDAQGLANSLLEASCSPKFQDAIVAAVRIALPHDEWRASTTSKDVADRLWRLLYRQYESGGPWMPTFFGRRDVLGKLDDWIETCKRGLAVICAASGGGKSAMLAEWCRRRNESGDHVVRHFVTLGQISTSEPESALAHLLVQLREIDRADPKKPEAAIPFGENNLINALYTRLKIPSADGRKLIIVVDAMDELASPFADLFLRDDIAEGNYVVVSQRALPDVTPPELRKWTSFGRGAALAAWRYDVPPMEAADVLPWLEERIGTMSEGDMCAIAERLTKVTNGLPLFLQKTIDVLMERFAVCADNAARMQLVLDLRDPFSGFLKDYIEGVVGGRGIAVDQPFSQDERLTFALLTQLLEPIPENDLRALLNASRVDEDLFGNLDRRLLRWLAIRPAEQSSDDQSDRISFDHPRLAVEFAAALDKRLIEEAQRKLLGWCQSAWPSRADAVFKKPIRGAQYPLKRLPDHWLLLDQADEAAKLLMDLTFIEERFLGFDGEVAAAMMGRDWRAWYSTTVRTRRTP